MNLLNILANINWLAILAASAVFFTLGGLWFTLFFGNAYATSLGREYNPQEKPKPIFIIGPLLCTIISTITNAIFLHVLNINTIGDAFTFGFIIGIGYLIPTMVNIAINPNMPHPLKYALLNAPYFLIGSVISSIIVVAIGN